MTRWLVDELNQSELQHWLDLRCLLWPGDLGDHLNEIQQYFCGQTPHIERVWGVRSNGIPVMGFLELSLRSYAEGTSDSPVPYVEGWFVRADARGRGAGKALMESAMGWASSRGFAYLASDTDLTNEGSIHAHHAIGFKEVGRQVAFLRQLKP